MSREARRNITALYNPMTVGELSAMIPSIPWLDYINTVLAPLHTITDDERIIVDTPDYFNNLTELLAETPTRSVVSLLLLLLLLHCFADLLAWIQRHSLCSFVGP